MDLMRTAVVVIVAYILGLGTGVVGGVWYSFHEFAAPVAPVSASPSPTMAASPSPSPTALALGSPSPSASAPTSPSPLASTSPPASPVAASPSPSGSGSPLASTSQASPSASPSPAAHSPSLAATPSPRLEQTETPTPTPSAKPAAATFVVSVNKGDGFKVMIDGEAVGKTPLTVHVAPGKAHHVKVLGGERYTSWEGKVTPQSGEKREIQATISYVPPPPPPPVYHAPPPPPVYHAPPPRHYSAPSGGGGRPSVQGNQRF